MKHKARNSAFRQKSNPAEDKKTRTRDITECIGFLELITKKAEASNKMAKQKIKKFIFTYVINLAKKTGLEPATFGVTGQYSNR